MDSKCSLSADVRWRWSVDSRLTGHQLWLRMLFISLCLSLACLPIGHTQELSTDHICMSDSDCALGYHCALPSLSTPVSLPGHCMFSESSAFATESNSDPSIHSSSSSATSDWATHSMPDHSSSAFESSAHEPSSVSFEPVLRSNHNESGPAVTSASTTTDLPSRDVTLRTSSRTDSNETSLENDGHSVPMMADPLISADSTLNGATVNLTTDTTATTLSETSTSPSTIANETGSITTGIVASSITTTARTSPITTTTTATTTPLPPAFSCKDRPCRNRGRCMNVVNGTYTCECQPGYFGERCEFTHCGRCQHGKCLLEEEDDEEFDSSRKASVYRCYCLSGFTGSACDEDINECLRRPCVNGTCVNRPGSYQCDCQRGFEGKHCEREINECAHNPCVNNATCTDLIGDYRCSCPAGFEGKNCERNIDECADRPCQNKG